MTDAEKLMEILREVEDFGYKGFHGITPTEARVAIITLFESLIPAEKASYKVNVPPFVIPDSKEEQWNDCRKQMLDNIGRLRQ